MDEMNIVAVCERQEEVGIHLENWGLLAHGEGHFVLQNGNEADPLFRSVFGVCIHEVESTPRVFLDVYEDVMSSHPVLAQYLLARRKLRIVKGEREWIVQHLRKMTNKKIVFPKELQFYIAQDLRKGSQNWPYFLQFKTKTPLPDQYSRELIEKMAKEVDCKEDVLQTLLKERPSVEKIRWFKKNLVQGKYSNLNPLEIFGIQGKTANYVSKIHSIEAGNGFDALSSDQIEGLNERIAHQIEKRHILDHILALQQLFVNPCDSVQLNLQRISENLSIISPQLLKAEVLKPLQEIRVDRCNLGSFLNQQPQLKDRAVPSNPLQYLCNTLKFLISFTWRDISLIIRFNLDEQLGITAFDVKIIDYELKEMSKLATTLVKNQKFLLNYLLNYLQKLKVQ